MKPKYKLTGHHIFFSRSYKDVCGFYKSDTGNFYFVVDGKGYQLIKVNEAVQNGAAKLRLIE